MALAESAISLQRCLEAYFLDCGVTWKAGTNTGYWSLLPSPKVINSLVGIGNLHF